jgi:hypothetical protein
MDRLTLSTRVEIDSLPLLHHHQRLVTLGSCFSEHIGLKLKLFKWDVLVNPLGTLFHPVAIFELLRLILAKEDLPESGFIELEGEWFHFALPNTFYGRSPQELKEKFSAVASEVRVYLKSKNIGLLMTLGTSQVYVEKRVGHIVANCHKLPSQRFEKKLLSLDEIEHSWARLQPFLSEDTLLMWTLSPVRHVRETLEINAVSKSILRYWIHQKVVQHPDHHYFPAFEIMNDELRDYRFYKDDYIHPNQLAVDYLWELFMQYRMEAAAQDFCQVWVNLLKRLDHRPQRSSSGSYKRFLEETKMMLGKLPGVNVQDELAGIEEKLRGLTEAPDFREKD